MKHASKTWSRTHIMQDFWNRLGGSELRYWFMHVQQIYSHTSNCNCEIGNGSTGLCSGCLLEFVHEQDRTLENIFVDVDVSDDDAYNR